MLPVLRGANLKREVCSGGVGVLSIVCPAWLGTSLSWALVGGPLEKFLSSLKSGRCTGATDLRTSHSAES